jgi:NADH dehydrogenase FAD-containing subunit
MAIDRRQLLTGAAGASALWLSGCAATAKPSRTSTLSAAPFLISGAEKTLMPKGRQQRVVVCGGGWGGVTVAKYLRQQMPDVEVVMLERNGQFFSYPVSNMWLVDLVDASFLTHEYLGVSEKYGYRYVQCEVLDIDRERQRVSTSLGSLDYDYLVLAPGIRYNYEAWFGNDRRMAEATRARFPAAYVSNGEQLALKQALHNFQGGDWVMTLPPPPQRCPPSPYERACMVGWWFKKNKIKGRVTILDHKDGIRPIGMGFKTAFEELYKDQITYVPNAHIQEVDPFNKRIKTSAGDMRFDHAVLMAPHQAGDLAWKAGTVGRDKQGFATGWSDVDPLMFRLRSDPKVYVIGDSVGQVSTTFLFYPKAGHVANQHGRIVAGYIADQIAGRPERYRLPDNLCYMMVNGDPREAINVRFDYKVSDLGELQQVQVDDNRRRGDLASENLRWASGKFQDMFG